MISNLTFEVTESQQVKLDKWKKSHRCNSKVKSLRYIFEIAPGLGYGLNVECSCGKKIELTEYDKW